MHTVMGIKDRLFGSFLDKFTTISLTLLIISTAVMLIQHEIAAQQQEETGVTKKELVEEMYQKRLEQDKKIYKEV